MLAAMDVVVHTSLREGLARCLPQAMLAQLPVIAFDIDGAREVVNKSTGRLVPARDVQSLILAMNEMTDAGLRAELGEQGRGVCQEKFAAKYMTRQIRELYQQVLNQHQ